MNPLFDLKAPKKPANLGVNSDLLIKCKSININLSATLEQALTEKLAKLKSEQWAENTKQISGDSLDILLTSINDNKANLVIIYQYVTRP